MFLKHFKSFSKALHCTIISATLFISYETAQYNSERKEQEPLLRTFLSIKKFSKFSLNRAL